MNKPSMTLFFQNHQPISLLDFLPTSTGFRCDTCLHCFGNLSKFKHHLSSQGHTSSTRQVEIQKITGLDGAKSPWFPVHDNVSNIATIIQAAIDKEDLIRSTMDRCLPPITQIETGYQESLFYKKTGWIEELVNDQIYTPKTIKKLLENSPSETTNSSLSGMRQFLITTFTREINRVDSARYNFRISLNTAHKIRPFSSLQTNSSTKKYATTFADFVLFLQRHVVFKVPLAILGKGRARKHLLNLVKNGPSEKALFRLLYCCIR